MVLLFIYSTVANCFLWPWGDEESHFIIYIHDNLINSCVGKKGFTFNSCGMSGILNMNLASTKSQIKVLFPDSGNQKT